MLALEFVDGADPASRTPDADLTRRVQAEALDRNLIVLTAGTWNNVVRIIPPLVTTADEVAQALAILAESLDAAGA
jgi:4-aminobutyrate aminotransferase-like enzyme